MASHRANAQYKSIDVNPSTSKGRKKKKNNQPVLHQAKEQRLYKNDRPSPGLVTGDLMTTPQTGKQVSEEDDGVFVSTNIMRVVLSGMQKGEKKGRRIFSFVALAGACIVVSVYLIIPIMICLHITDTILAVLIAALILTVMEGIVGIILVRIGTSRELKKSRLGKKASASVQQSAVSALLPMPRLSPAKSPALLPMPRLSPAKSPAQPAFLPVVPAVGVPEQMRVGNAGRPPMPVTDPIRLAEVAQMETIRVTGSMTSIVPPFLKLPASS